ncbi:MAG TPA: GFA family protein [Caulobacterales bacterium]|nr:GFA family protein [Caulobacterales bacterium]
MIEGGCLCGAVRYTARGEPIASLLCYCRDCQRASGSGHVPVMVVGKAGFVCTGPVAAYPPATEKSGGRHFCSVCGSLLFGLPESTPDQVTLYVGALDEPGRFQPTDAIFLRDRNHWDVSALDLNGHDRLPGQDQ